jgi:hypothetical protein
MAVDAKDTTLIAKLVQQKFAQRTLLIFQAVIGRAAETQSLLRIHKRFNHAAVSLGNLLLHDTQVVCPVKSVRPGG